MTLAANEVVANKVVTNKVVGNEVVAANLLKAETQSDAGVEKTQSPEIEALLQRPIREVVTMRLFKIDEETISTAGGDSYYFIFLSKVLRCVHASL